jgi:CubicO group peptidase (beta-lactamase class C family)
MFYIRLRRVYASLLVIGLLATSLASPLSAQADSNGTFPGRTWYLSPPDASQWSADALRQADDMARNIGTDAYLVVHHGAIVHQYGQVSKPMNLYSGRKSVLSMLIGIAQDRQSIDLNATLAELGIDDQSKLTETEKTATARQLLQARSGVYHPAAYETAAMKEVRPARGSHDAGSFWYYNNWDFNALGAIYQKLSGKDVFTALNNDLALPLQFEDFDQARDTEYVYERASQYPAYVMHLSARDTARLGLLMARAGRWQDRQIVSKHWVTESTTSYSDTSPGVGYGYLWWVGQKGWHFGQKFPGPVFSARGNFGQYLIVDPLRDLVIVHRVNPSTLAMLFSTGPTGGQFNTLLKQILSAAPKDF